jgi:titin
VPTAPQNLAASPHKAKGINLTWAAPASDGGVAISGYRIYRGTASGSLSLIATVGNVTSYRDASTSRGVRYFYQVAAINAAGESPRSNLADTIAK